MSGFYANNPNKLPLTQLDEDFDILVPSTMGINGGIGDIFDDSPVTSSAKDLNDAVGKTCDTLEDDISLIEIDPKYRPFTQPHQLEEKVKKNDDGLSQKEGIKKNTKKLPFAKTKVSKKHTTGSNMEKYLVKNGTKTKSLSSYIKLLNYQTKSGITMSDLMLFNNEENLGFNDTTTGSI